MNIADLTLDQVEEFNSYCKRIVNKEVDPPNDLIKHTLTRLLDDRERLVRARVSMSNLQERMLRLEGSISGYENIIDDWIIQYLFENEESKPDLELIDGDKDTAS